jgi:hypothetical protein
MIQSYSIGEADPWRLTKVSGYRLAEAIITTGAKVIYAGWDTTCPAGYASLRFQMDTAKIGEFKEVLGARVDVVEEAGGAA